MIKKTVVVIDDDEEILELIKDSLEDLSFTVIAMSDSSKVLEKINVDKIDCVLTDVLMPKLDGVQLALKLREKNYTGPIFFITGYSDYPREVLNQVKPQAIIFKPFDVEEAAILIKNHLMKL
jgi:DNA-binding NtrC family response regulator